MPLTGPDVLLYEKKDRVVTMTLNRPQRMNAINKQMHYDMLDALTDVKKDDSVRVFVLTGKGRAKVELGLARGKNLHDRRRDIADRDSKRDIARELADVQRGR